MRQHELAIAALVARSRVDPECLAIVVTGSVARGTERADSDVDLYRVVSDECFESAERDGLVMFTSTEGIGYEHGYFDVKLCSPGMLAAAAERGDDPVRASFEGARIAYSRIDDLAATIDRIRRPPADHGWESRLVSQLAQASLHGRYFLPHGEEVGDRMLLHSAAVHLATAACRAVLAHQRVLYPGPKDLVRTVAAVPDSPAGFLAAIDRLLDSPGRGNADAVLAAVEPLWPEPLDDDRILSRFVADNELAWYLRTPVPEYR